LIYVLLGEIDKFPRNNLHTLTKICRLQTQTDRLQVLLEFVK